MDLSGLVKRMFESLDKLKDLVDRGLPEPERTPFHGPMAGIAMYAGMIAATMGYDLVNEKIEGEVEIPPGLDLSEPHQSLVNAIDARPKDVIRSKMLDHSSDVLRHIDKIAEMVGFKDEEGGEKDDGCSVMLTDQSGSGGTQDVVVEARPHGVLLYAAGYGDKTSEPPFGSPVVLELYEGKLRLIVWADINQEDPTHIIDLSGAMEKNRKEE